MHEMQQHLAGGQPAHCKQCTLLTPACTSSLVQEVGQDEMEGTVLWKEQLCLERVRLRSTSQVVVEVHHQKEGSFEPEMIAWAHAPIMQVGRWSWAGTTRCSTTRRAPSGPSRLSGFSRSLCRYAGLKHYVHAALPTEAGQLNRSRTGAALPEGRLLQAQDDGWESSTHSAGGLLANCSKAQGALAKH